MSSRLVAVLDADMLVPILSCDLLLCAFDDLYQLVVTGRIPGRSRTHPRHRLRPPRPRRRPPPKRTGRPSPHLPHPPGHRTDGGGGRGERQGSSRRRVALAAKADVVVSNDRRLRRQINHLDTPFRAVTADDLMVGLHDADRDGVDEVIATMVAKRVRRPVTRAELIGHLAGSFPRLAAALTGDG